MKFLFVANEIIFIFNFVIFYFKGIIFLFFNRVPDLVAVPSGTTREKHTWREKWLILPSTWTFTNYFWLGFFRVDSLFDIFIFVLIFHFFKTLFQQPKYFFFQMVKIIFFLILQIVKFNFLFSIFQIFENFENSLIF